jgi:hypothetical protein
MPTDAQSGHGDRAQLMAAFGGTELKSPMSVFNSCRRFIDSENHRCIRRDSSAKRANGS